MDYPHYPQYTKSMPQQRHKPTVCLHRLMFSSRRSHAASHNSNYIGLYPFGNEIQMKYVIFISKYIRLMLKFRTKKHDECLYMSCRSLLLNLHFKMRSILFLIPIWNAALTSLISEQAQCVPLDVELIGRNCSCSHSILIAQMLSKRCFGKRQLYHNFADAL